MSQMVEPKMTTRMTDERLAEIVRKLVFLLVLDDSNAGYFGGVGPLAKELLQALKAERERIAELEAEKKSLFTAAKPHLKENKKLQATIYEIEGLPDKWEDPLLMPYGSHFANELRAIIKRQSE